MHTTVATIAVAESCTGGMISAALTRRPGSSASFLLGIVCYSNRAKNRMLGVPAATLARYGAVSSQTARIMAAAVRRIAAADIGIAVTGIAGPSGAVPGKPVGTVFIAQACARGVRCRKFLFRGSRSAVRRQARDTALRLLGKQR